MQATVASVRATIDAVTAMWRWASHRKFWIAWRLKTLATRSKLVLLVLVMVVGLALGMLVTDHLETEHDRVVVTGVAQVGGPFQLRTADGRHVTDQDLRGSVVVLQFASAQDGGISASAARVLHIALQKWAGAKTPPLGFIVDLDAIVRTDDNDTAQVLQETMRAVAPSLTVLTGDARTIGEMAVRFRLPFKIVDAESVPAATRAAVDPAYFILDRSGAFATYLPYDNDVTAVQRAVDTILSR